MSFVPPEKTPAVEPSHVLTTRAEIEGAPKRQHRFFAPIVIVVVALISGGLGLGFSLLGTAISSFMVSADPYDDLYDDDDYVEEEPKPRPTDDIDFMGYGPEEPLLTGDPAPPRAKVPTVCEWECFGYYALSAPSPSTIELENNGLVGVNEDNWWYGSVADAHAQGLDQWRASGSTPEQCFATAPLMPINLDISGEATPDREVLHTDPGHLDADDTTTFVQSNRIFATSQLAETYLVQLDREIRGCTSFTSPDGRLNTVSLAPALEVPDSIGVVGWVVSSPDSRTYVFDLQRGNLVERTVMTSRQGMGEADFRAIVVGVATRIDKVHFDCENPECS